MDQRLVDGNSIGCIGIEQLTASIIQAVKRIGLEQHAVSGELEIALKRLHTAGLIESWRVDAQITDGSACTLHLGVQSGAVDHSRNQRSAWSLCIGLAPLRRHQG